MSELDTAIYELAINNTYPGLQMFVRDVNLPLALAAKYTDGLVVREKSYCDASR